MTPDPEILITISRSTAAGGPDPLILSGSDDENLLGITDFTPPGMNARIIYAPDSRYFDGAEDTAVAWNQALLAFSWFPDHADDEADVDSAYWEFVAAVAQRRYDVTTKISDGPELTWRAKRANVSPDPRSFSDLVNNNPGYAVTIPVHPIPTGA